MKRILLIGAVLALVGSVATAELPVVVTGNHHGITNSSTFRATGYLQSIHIDQTAGCTSTVWVATGYESLCSFAGVAADVVKRPRVGVQRNDGFTLAFTNEHERVWLDGETVTVSVHGTQSAKTNDVTVRFWISPR